MIKTKPKYKANIMIVEDELEVAKNIKEHLDKIGYNVIAIITKGEDAVKQLAELHPQPDLVLMDIHLPVQNPLAIY
ncbi:MAG: response regulator [Acidobacteria bacterium]|nr:response regulator [Acidobacteriota bacterium]